MTVPLMGERMVAQSSVACISLTASLAAAGRPPRNFNAVAAFSYSWRLMALDFIKAALRC